MIDFKDLNQRLLARGESLLRDWLPGGKKEGREYVCADINGGSGGSFSVNLETGIWAEFSGQGIKGGDLISLWAAKRGISQVEAAKELDEGKSKSLPFANKKNDGVWIYKDASGNPVACVARFNEKDGKKTFRQASVQCGEWVYKSHPSPRPLYNLDILVKNPKQPCLIVEGEKTADAAMLINGIPYICTTWIGGAQSILNKTDWSPLYGRKILLCPDADEPGRIVMNKIASLLLEHCPSIKIIDTSDRPAGWDLADNQGLTWDIFKAWATPLAKEYAKPVGAEIVEPVPPSQSEPATVNNLALIMAPDNEDPGTVGPMTAVWEEIGLQLANNKPVNNITNVCRVIRNDENLKNSIWYDSFHRKIFINGQPIDDSAEVEFTAMLQHTYGLTRMDKATVRDGLINYAFKNVRNEPKEWLESLKWDGVDRVTEFFTTYFSSESDEYHRHIAKYFWASIPARILDPGCKCDCMVVLQGNQGKGKSQSCEIIGGKWHFESCNEIGTKDFLQSLHGVMLMEISELASLQKAKNEAIKLTLTSRRDHFRLPYGRNVETFPRQCVFIGTTNEDEFICDQTGGRRFYPVTTGDINLDGLRRDRDQLFAQGVQIYKNNLQNWWSVPSEFSEIQQESRRVADPWEELITIKAINRAGFDIYRGIQLTEISEKILQMKHEHADRITSKRIIPILKRLGFRLAYPKDKNRNTLRVWRIERSGGYVDGDGNYKETANLSTLNNEMSTLNNEMSTLIFDE